MSNHSKECFMCKDEMLDCVEQAFEERQFRIYFQPQYNHTNGRMIGAEALVRWIHPQYGLQMPNTFIPVLETEGYITKLDLYVFEEVCRFQRKCLDDHIDTVPISFNVSRYNLAVEDFIERMEQIRKLYGVPVSLLRVEILESAAVGGNDHLARIVEKFHSFGYLVEMDDFGSGYSSLAVLKDVEVDIIKLDMIFLRGKIGGRGGIIISSVVRMAHWLKTPVIVEGVEEIAQADYMKSIGCQYIQGYLYSKPVPEDEFIQLLHEVKKDVTAPYMKFIDSLDAEKFWDPHTMETMIFSNFVSAAAIFIYENDEIEMLRVNEKYLKELCMNMNQKEVIIDHKSLDLDEANKKIYIAAIKRAIESNDYETCETWRIIHSPCCGEDSLCIRSTLQVIGRSDGQYLFFATIQNITAEKKMYMELSDNEKKFRTAGEQLNIYCWEYEVETKEMRPCSRCIRDLGLAPLIKNYPEPVIESGLFPSDYADMYRNWHRQLEKGAESLDAIIPLTADRIPFHVRYTAEFDENGRPYKAYGSATLVANE